ncbi:unnamed protein product [Orchesella dallaii]|uniref:Cupin-like domain-containing protein n=1 Tax=Orchesella dallaii TaxID=48710 RepID=A0ABP1REE0_9HEXA
MGKKGKKPTPDNPVKEDPNVSRLHKLIFTHCKQQLKDGVKMDEILTFLHNQKLVDEFFDKQKDPAIGVDGQDEDKDTKLKKGLRLIGTFYKIIFFTILFLVTALMGHIGVCQWLDINPLQNFPTIQETRCLIPVNHIIMEIARPLADCAYCSAGDAVIEMNEIPSKEEFLKVAYLSKTIIIRGGAEKLGVTKRNLSIDKIKDIFASERGGIRAVAYESTFLPFTSPFNTLEDALEIVNDNFIWTGEDGPWYFGWSNEHLGASKKLKKLFPRPDFLPDEYDTTGSDWIFIGTPGPGAPMHLDYVRRPSWQAQLSGIKRWQVRPVYECESACPNTVTFTVNTGDMVFVDTNLWFHQTFVEGDKLSMSIGWEYD